MQKGRSIITTKAIACCALLAALSIVMARWLSFATPDGIRWSLDKFPLFIAGMLFGPVFGGLTGFTADFLGSLMQFGFNPFLCPPAILYGVFGGLFQAFLLRKTSLLRIGVSYLFPIVIGSILYQSLMLSYFYFDGALAEGFLYYLGTRSFQFSIMLVAEVFIIYTLMRANVFTRVGLWPPANKERKSS